MFCSRVKEVQILTPFSHSLIRWLPQTGSRLLLDQSFALDVSDQLHALTWTSPWCPWWDRRSSRPGWRRRKKEGRGCASTCRWCWCRSERCWPAWPSPAAGRPGRWQAGWGRSLQVDQIAVQNSFFFWAHCWRPPSGDRENTQNT